MIAFMRCVLLAVLLALVAGPLAAVEVSVQGAQVLLFPLYHASSERSTLVAIENRDNVPKAVLIRLREQRNGRPVLTFNLYLGSHDLWTAAIASDPVTQAPMLITTDESCTAPALFRSETYRGRIGLRPFEYSGANRDTGPEDLARARVGFIEAIDLGALDPAGELAAQVNQQSAGTCGALVARFAPGAPWAVNALAGFLPPRGGLSGFSTLIDVAAGTSWAIPVTSLAGFRDRPGHADPSRGITLADATGPDPDWIDAWVQTVDGRARYQYPKSRAIDAVSAVLMSESLATQYSVEPELGARSELVLSFPTKWAYTDQVLTPASAIPPFQSLFQQDAARFTVNSTVADDDRVWSRASCLLSVTSIWSCDEVGFLPPPSPPLPTLSGTVTSISMNATESTPSGLIPEFRLPDRSAIPVRGRISIGLRRPLDQALAAPLELRPDRQGRILKGLPVIGVHLQSAHYDQASTYWLGSYGLARAMQPILQE